MAVKVDVLSEDGFFTNTDGTLNCAIKKPDGTPQDVSGWTFSWVLKKRTKDAAALLTKVSPAILIIDAVLGQVRVVISDTDTVGLLSGVYVHELKRTNEGFESVLIPGKSAPTAVFILQQSAHP